MRRRLASTSESRAAPRAAWLGRRAGRYASARGAAGDAGEGAAGGAAQKVL